jgi:4-carboxymuconolactone decarboxylase
MQPRITLLSLAFCAACSVVMLNAQSAALPPDVDSKTYSRLPMIQRSSLDANGQRIYDFMNGTNANGTAAATPRLGPINSTLYSPVVGEPFEAINRALRKSVIGTHTFEICTLLAAWEYEQQYEWSAHEIAAQKAGVDQKTIDAIKFNRGLDGVPEKDATLVRFGRDLLRKHKVDSALYAKVIEQFGWQGMIDITVAIGDYVMTALVLNAVDQQLPPDRKALLPNR